MKKLVKLYISGMPVTLSDSIKAFGYHGPLELDIKDIFRCLVSGATVKEVLNNGKEINLTLSNYNKNNNVEICKEEPAKVEPPKPVHVNEIKPDIVSKPQEFPAPEPVMVEYKEEVAMPSNSVFISGEAQVVEEAKIEEAADMEEETADEEVTEEDTPTEEQTPVEQPKPKYQPPKNYQNGKSGKNRHNR